MSTVRGSAVPSTDPPNPPPPPHSTVSWRAVRGSAVPSTDPPNPPPPPHSTVSWRGVRGSAVPSTDPPNPPRLTTVPSVGGLSAGLLSPPQTHLTLPASPQYRQLEGCPRDLLPASGSVSPGRPERLQLFSEFHQLSAKRQRLTAGDVFAKMLLQLSGLSVDKAAAIVSVYPTVARLLEAYRRCGTPAEAEGLLTPLRAEKSGRPVGAAVSKAVYHLYCDQQLS